MGASVKYLMADEARELDQALSMLYQNIHLCFSRRPETTFIEELSEVNDGFVKASQDHDPIRSYLAHSAFHNKILSGIPNSVVADAIQRLETMLLSIRHHPATNHNSHLKNELSDHQKMIELIKSGNTERLGEVFASHSRSSIELYLSHSRYSNYSPRKRVETFNNAMYA